MQRKRAFLIVGIVLLLTIAGGFFDYPQAWNTLADRFGFPHFPSRPFQLGLDIAGGTSLTYRADLSNIPEQDRSDAMEGLRDVVERRVNLFGVKEPRVEIAKAPEEWRLIVELAGVKDINEAIKLIGATPFLEFKEEWSPEEGARIIQIYIPSATGTAAYESLCNSSNLLGLLQFLQAYGEDPCFKTAGLTGKYLSRATVDFEPNTGEPVIALQFNDEGTKLFGEITMRNVGKRLAVYLDGIPRQAPVVREAIPSGRAQISGGFTINEAKTRTRELNQGALPVPVQLISQRSIGAVLGEEALAKSIRAGIFGFALVAVFMLILYRFSGFVAVLALGVYAVVVLAVFKLIPVTLTLAGIAGFVLSVGMAVDANILIFERTKEELRRGRTVPASLQDGFSRAWPSIRDSNISTIITSLVLYTFATSIIKGFALTLFFGVFVSMFSAIFVSRSLLAALLPARESTARWWFGIKRTTPSLKEEIVHTEE